MSKRIEAPIPAAVRHAPSGPVREKTRSADQIPAAIQWHDGLLLEPHHFQESARRSERLFDYHLAQLSPFHFGVVAYTIDQGLLPGGRLRLNTLEAVMPDGLVVWYPFKADDRAVEAPWLDLTAYGALFDKGPVTVHLAVVGEEAAAERGEARFATGAAAYAYDEIGRGDKLEVPRLLPRVKLVVPAASSARSPTDVTMPVCRLKRGTKNVFEEVEYEPPCLRVAAGPLLDLCKDGIVKPLKDKAMRLATTARKMKDATPEGWQRKAELKRQAHALCAGLPPLEALLESGAHPYAVYLALAGLVGQVAAASVELIPPAPAASFPYRHEELLDSFAAARDYVTSVSDAIPELFDQYPLDYDVDRRRYQASMPPEFRDRCLALAVRPLDGPRSDLRDLFGGACVCAESRVDDNVKRRATGAARGIREDVDDLAAQRLLSDIVAPAGSLVYLLDATSPELDRKGPFVVFNLGDGTSKFELTLYVSRDPVAETAGAR